MPVLTTSCRLLPCTRPPPMRLPMHAVHLQGCMFGIGREALLLHQDVTIGQSIIKSTTVVDFLFDWEAAELAYVHLDALRPSPFALRPAKLMTLLEGVGRLHAWWQVDLTWLTAMVLLNCCFPPLAWTTMHTISRALQNH